jgi:hypothetical protein
MLGRAGVELGASRLRDARGRVDIMCSIQASESRARGSAMRKVFSRECGTSR